MSLFTLVFDNSSSDNEAVEKPQPKDAGNQEEKANANESAQKAERHRRKRYVGAKPTNVVKTTYHTPDVEIGVISVPNNNIDLDVDMDNRSEEVHANTVSYSPKQKGVTFDAENDESAIHRKKKKRIRNKSDPVNLDEMRKLDISQDTSNISAPVESNDVNVLNTQEVTQSGAMVSSPIKSASNENLPTLSWVPSERKPYVVTRSKLITLMGTRKHFQLFYNENSCMTPLYHTKIKSTTDVICFSKGSEMHFSDKVFSASMLKNECLTTFSVRRGSRLGPEMLMIRFRNSKKENERRMARITVILEGNMKYTLNSVGPNNFPKVAESLDVQLPQRLNNIIIANDKQEPVIVQMQQDENTLFIWCDEKIDPICVFGLGIASFISE